MLRILSLGAGVQSTTVLLMSEKGLLPKLDCAIFADTGWEPEEVYEHMKRLSKHCKTPIHGVSKRKDGCQAYLRDDEISGGKRTFLPCYVKTVDGGVKRRKCTIEYKINPIEDYMRRGILKLKPRQRAPKEPVIEQWFGISVDEAQRMRTSRESWKVNEYPLCGFPTEYLPKSYSRADCVEWLKDNWPYAVPRSACLGCPYHSDAEWRRIKTNPKYWADVTEFDRAIRHSGGMRGEVFLHRSLKPLEEVDFSTAEEKGQLNMFNNECQGMCGI